MIVFMRKKRFDQLVEKRIQEDRQTRSLDMVNLFAPELERLYHSDKPLFIFSDKVFVSDFLRVNGDAIFLGDVKNPGTIDIGRDLYTGYLITQPGATLISGDARLPGLP